jgi:cytochrome P450
MPHDAALPPGPRSRIPGRILARFAGDRLGFLEEIARTHGDVSWFGDLGVSLALLSHPDHVRDVLVTQARHFHKGIGLQRSRLLLGEGLLTSEAPFHLRQRRLMQPAFHRERVAAYGDVMSRYAERHVLRWRDGMTMDVASEMAALTLAVAGKTLFDADVEGDTQAVGEALEQAIDAFGLVLLPFGELLARLPIPPANRFRDARARLDALVYRLIGERRAELAAGGRDRGDLLTMLIVAQDAEGEGEGTGESSGAATSMTDEQVRDEALTILLAGHETTANALTWSWWFIARHPEVEQALHAEADAVLSTGDGRPRAATVDDLARLPYARMVVAESMRLRPPAYILGRRALVPYAVPGTSWVVPAGTTVFMSQHIVHRDPRWWPDAERFDPRRWEGDAAQQRPRMAYFPFGAGTRVCIAEQFAWMELVLVLSSVARRWRLRLVPGHPVEPHPVITLRAKHGIRVVAEARVRD